MAYGSEENGVEKYTTSEYLQMEMQAALQMLKECHEVDL